MPDSGGNKKVKHSLVALGSAAVLAVYTAGYERTRVAADRIALQAAERRPVVPGPASSAVSAPAESVNEAPTVLTPRVTDASAATPVTAPLPQAAPTAERDAVAIDTASRSPRPPEAASPAPADVNPLRSVAPIEASPAPSPALPAWPEPQVSALSPSSERADVTSVTAPTTPPAAVNVASLYKDGTYAGWGSCRHGTIEATIVIAAGRIESARISQCRTRYSCSWIADLPGQVVARQSPEVDYVSGATQSVDAFYYAVAEALSKAK